MPAIKSQASAPAETARQKDDEHDQQNQAEKAAAHDWSADIKSATSQQQQQNDEE